MNKKKLLTVFSIILMILFVVSISNRVMQNDTFWSIEVGEKIIKEGIIRLDNFSIHEGLNYVAQHFLTDVVIYLIYNVAGFTGLYIYEIILACILSALLYLLNKEISKNKYMSFCMTFIQMFIMRGYIAVRAQNISFIIFLIELILLERYKRTKGKKYIVVLSILPIILANFHMGVVPFYFIILGVYILSFVRIKFLQRLNIEIIEKTDIKAIKQLLLVFVIGIVTIFLNPYGVDGVIYPFKTIGNSFINSYIFEFKAYSMSLDGGYILFYIALIIGILIFTKNKFKLEDILLILGTLFMTFTAIRYASLFVICSSVVLRCVHIKGMSKEDKKAIVATMYVVISVVVFLSLGNLLTNLKDYVPKDEYPVDAVEYLKDNQKERVIYNDYGWGSYLMLNDMKVFIDSRCDLYTKEYSGKDIADDYINISLVKKEYEELLNKYNINTILTKNESNLDVLLNENEQYECVYRDETAVIYELR